MNSFKLFIPLLSTLIFLAGFFIGGYFLSDAVFFKNLIKQHELTTPDQIWNYLNPRIFPNDPLDLPPKGLSARYMLENKKYLSCDEGALLMATILRECGYKTRIKDLYGPNNTTIPLHSVLEVEEDGLWYIYDTFFKLNKTSLEISARHRGFALYKTETRPSWSFYRSIVYYNFFLKFLIFQIRGIAEYE